MFTNLLNINEHKLLSNLNNIELSFYDINLELDEKLLKFEIKLLFICRKYNATKFVKIKFQ